jgi:hypothetical protein
VDGEERRAGLHCGEDGARGGTAEAGVGGGGEGEGLARDMCASIFWLEACRLSEPSHLGLFVWVEDH